MRSVGLLVATIGVGLLVLALVQYEIRFLGEALSWLALLGVIGVIFIALGAGLVLNDRA